MNQSGRTKIMQISLSYGTSQVEIELPSNRFDILGVPSEAPALSDAQIGERFADPIDSKPLEDLVSSGETVLIVVPDATRMTACDSIANLLVRRLIANGTMPYEISIIFATGIHRAVTNDEKRRLLTPFIFQRIKTLDHSARDLMRAAGLESTVFSDFGELNGEPVELNRTLVEYGHVIIVGGVTFHYFAGFTGGRKLICPGLASERTIAATHRLAFDFETKSRRAGVGPGLLEGNAVHEAFVEVASHISPTLAVNTIVNDRGQPTEVFCGNWQRSHIAACDSFAAGHSIDVQEKRDVVIVSCGGAPFDVNMIQAQKALDAASRACRDGGTIILVAECAEGLGRADFLKWFNAGNSEGIADMLCDRYEVNGQTAWSLSEKAERFEIRIVTSLGADETSKMGLKKVDSIAGLTAERSGYVLPFGSKYLLK